MDDLFGSERSMYGYILTYTSYKTKLLKNTDSVNSHNADPATVGKRSLSLSLSRAKKIPMEYIDND